MTKFRFYLDKDKETAWLNQQAEKGLAMTKFFAGFYFFEECSPGEYTYQVDFGEKFFAVSDNYREFMEENGIEIIQPWGFWIFLRRKTSEGAFLLYTDVDSSIEHYTKIKTMFKAAAIAELVCFLAECFCAASGSAAAIRFVVLSGLFALALIKAALKTNQTIAELKERKGETAVPCNSKLSPLLPCGLLLNSCTLITSDSFPQSVKLSIQIIAILFMLIGIYRTRHIFKR